MDAAIPLRRVGGDTLNQSVLGQFPDAPVALLMSMEADLYPRARPELADKVDGAIGALTAARDCSTVSTIRPPYRD